MREREPEYPFEDFVRDLRHRGRAVVARIQSLATEPRPVGCVKLSGADKYRIRHGDYRILYTIRDDRVIVVVVRVAHRKKAHR